ncbi:hypothetical protein SK128_007989 [Halocaridina rubra]|uniref:Uncharacterized protein n=1 Tax=Halocaridina rubra TaxID=373956 RepID=A0AAN8WXL0_HALRR
MATTKTKTIEEAPRLSLADIGLRPSLALAGDGHDVHPGSSVDGGTGAIPGGGVGHGFYGGNGQDRDYITPGISTVSTGQEATGGYGQGNFAGLGGEHIHQSGQGLSAHGTSGVGPGHGSIASHIHLGGGLGPQGTSGLGSGLGNIAGHIHGVGPSSVGSSGVISGHDTNVGHIHGNGHNFHPGDGYGAVLGGYGSTGVGHGYGSYGGTGLSTGIGHSGILWPINHFNI